jgi:hypothetical protein
MVANDEVGADDVGTDVVAHNVGADEVGTDVVAHNVGADREAAEELSPLQGFDKRPAMASLELSGRTVALAAVESEQVHGNVLVMG